MVAHGSLIAVRRLYPTYAEDVDLLAACPGLSPDQKIAWLVEHQLVFATDTHHEAFSLLRSAYPSLSSG